MFKTRLRRTPRWRGLIAASVAAASLAAISAPLSDANAATSCFAIEVAFDTRMSVPEIDEASGLVLSRQMPGVMWTHNDHDPGASNNENNRIYAVNEGGDLLATVQFQLSGGLDIVPGQSFVELEDISFGYGPGADPDYLYLADTGDNTHQRDYASLYRFAEPVFTPDAQNPVTINISESELDATRFRYESLTDPDGIAEPNVEAMFIDPATGHTFLVEKGLHSVGGTGQDFSFVYRVRAEKLFPANPATVRLATIESHVRGQFAVSTFGITGADISADGTIIAMRNKDETFYWVKNPGTSVLSTLNAAHEAPCMVPQGANGEIMKGEGLAIGPTSDRFVSIREGVISPIWQGVLTDQAHTCFGRPATILGTAGDDAGSAKIIGTPDADVIVTFGGNDEVYGKGGADRICLGPGDDYAQGGTQRDRIDGSWGHDTIEGGNGKDILRGSTGRDTISGDDQNDRIYGGDGKDNLGGGAGSDSVFGEGSSDRIRGWTGGDTLVGGSGADQVDGGGGNDALTGGGGIDSCEGGVGTDTARGCEDVSGVP